MVRPQSEGLKANGGYFWYEDPFRDSGPAHRHVMAAMRNSNFYEVALVGPDCPNAVAPVYRCGYTDQLDCIGDDGRINFEIGRPRQVRRPAMEKLIGWGRRGRLRLVHHKNIAGTGRTKK